MGLLSRFFRKAPDPSTAWRAEAIALRAAGDVELAERIERLADAPHDATAAFDAGTLLVSRGEAARAVPLLEHGLALLPFDAILRSELALAQTHAGEPREALATLALHPCLADDPGALFSLGWCALVTGDLDIALRARDDLAPHSGTHALAELLAAAIGRAQLAPFSIGDCRERYFVETGGLLLGGDAVGDAAWIIRTLELSPDVVPADETARDLAVTLTAATGGAVLAVPPNGRLPRATLVARDVETLVVHHDRLGASGEVITFALTHPVARAAPLAPDLLGALTGGAAAAGDLHAFVAARRALLPRRDTVRPPYVPDLPRIGVTHLPSNPPKS